jgi:hypothetical protein
MARELSHDALVKKCYEASQPCRSDEQMILNRRAQDLTGQKNRWFNPGSGFAPGRHHILSFVNDFAVDGAAVGLVDGLLKRAVHRYLPEGGTGAVLLFPSDLTEVDALKELSQIRIIVPAVK